MEVQNNDMLHYVHPDHLGTPRAVTRTTDNAVVWRWESAQPFGGDLANQNPGGLGVFNYNLRFPGQYFDRETGKHYNYMRDYDPTIGRYVESDPVGLKGGVNTYSYVNQAPIGLTDPYGLWCVCTTDVVAWTPTTMTLNLICTRVDADGTVCSLKRLLKQTAVFGISLTSRSVDSSFANNCHLANVFALGENVQESPYKDWVCIPPVCGRSIGSQ